MDAHLVARELEMTLLAKLLESRHVNASSNISMPAAALLHLLREYLGPGVTMPDLKAACNTSEHLTWTPYAREIEIAGIRSDEGVRLTVFRWNKFAATAEPFRTILATHEERPRPPIAATTFRGGPLGLKKVSFEIRNEGYGTQEDVLVRRVTAPDWVAARRTKNRITLSACPAQGGVYRGQVTVTTNVNNVTLDVSTESAAFSLPARNELTLEELIPVHPDIDRDATERLLEKVLRQLKYERLPGGLFIKHGAASSQVRSNDWWLTESEILTGGLTGLGYPARFMVYADADGKVDKYNEEVTAEHGQLGGGLADLFEYLDVQVGQRLSLTPYKGGYKMTLSPAEPWRTARGHTFWLQGPAATVLNHPEVLDALLQRADEKNVTINLLLSGDAALPDDLVRQHRAGRLTIRHAAQPLPYRLIVCDEDGAAYVPPHGPMQRPAAPPQSLWDTSSPLEGRDYRELAWQRGRRGEDSDEWGLLDLELSVAMAKLANALRPLPTQAVKVTEAQRKRLLLDLPKEARQWHIDQKPTLAAPLLERFGLSPEQVNAHGYGVRVTAGGYLVRRPQDLGGQRDWAAYVGNLYGGVIHHSQLRKLVEAFTGQRLESTSFVTSSLAALGWAGNGYRRPRQTWEPGTRELSPFVAEVLVHFDTRQEALGWLRRNVAATEAQLERAMTKAAPLVAHFMRQAALTTPTPTAMPQESMRQSPASTKGKGKGGGKAPAVPTPPQKTAHASKQQAVKRELKFELLRGLSTTLADPRSAERSAVKSDVLKLIQEEGPITQTWLVRRYSLLSRLNIRQVQASVQGVLDQMVEQGEVNRVVFPCGHTEYLRPGQSARLRERGTRNPEDISFGEWCELLHALGLTTEDCDEARAHKEAIRAYRFGSDAQRVRPLIGMALSAARQSARST